MTERMRIWGREFDLKVIFDLYSGEDILDTQKAALEKFTQLPELADNALQAVKEYCCTHGSVTEVDNIFRYVIPTSIFVKRNEKERMIALMCNFRFDPEHGLAIVFTNESLSALGPQDIVL